MLDMDEREKLLRQAILLSEDAKTFRESDLYAAMAARAESDEQEALEQLCTVDASKQCRIVELQSAVTRARSFKGWINELIIEGDQAYIMFVEENKEVETE